MIINELHYSEISSDIFLFKKVISEELCKTIIDIIEKYPNWQDSTIGENNKLDKSYRSNKVDYLTDRFGYNSEIYYAHNTLGYYVKRIIEELDKIYSVTNLNYSIGLFTNISTDQGFQILKYEKGEMYHTHVDSSNKNFRVLSLIIYLNENYEGGETSFVRQNIKVKGNTGDILTFPSNHCFPHKSNPIIKGTKYAMVTWFK